MKNISILIFVMLIVAVLVVYLVSFQVRETEKALVTTFGKPTRAISEPGWYPKWPSPIQTVHKFDSRINLFKGVMEETTTKGGEPIIVTSYVVWNIGEPLKFLESVRDKRGAEQQLKSLLRNSQNSVVGAHYFSEFVNSDPAKIRFEQIEDEMLADIKEQAMTDYGIEIRDVGITQLGVSEKVTQDVFERMKADRLRKTEATIAQGEAEAIKIMTDAESKRTELLAIVQAKAKAIRGAGDAEAAKYYKMLEADPELAMFLRDIEALKKILKEKTTIVLGSETEPIKLLKEMPDIRPREK